MSKTALRALLFALLGFVVSANAQQTVDVGPEDGVLCCNGLNAFLFQGDDILVVTGRAGVMRFDHRTGRWQRSMDGLVATNDVSPFVGFACQSPSMPGVLYALAGNEVAATPFNGLFSSRDFGRHWTRRAATDTGRGLNFCAVDAADLDTLYVSGTDSTPALASRTWRSSDGGRTVQDITALLPACAQGGVVVTARGAVYARGADCIARSIDQGATFQLLPTPAGKIGGFSASADNGTLLLASFDAALHYVATFRSTDSGVTWLPAAGLPDGFSMPLGFDPTDASRVYAAIGPAAYVSRDGGATFAALPGDPRFLGSNPATSIAADAHGSVWLIGLAGPGPFRSDDGGQTWHPVVDGFRASAVQDLAFDANGSLLVGVLHTQAAYRQGQGRSYVPLGRALVDPSGPAGITIAAAAVAGSPVDANVVLVASDGDLGLVRTADGGQTWTRSSVAGHPDGFASGRMRFATGTRVYVVAPNAVAPGLYRSDDGGRTFARLSRTAFGAIAVLPGNPDTLYLGTYGKRRSLFKSTDGGHTLQPLGRIGDFSALAIDRRDPQVLYAGERLGGVIRSVDGGQTFAAASAGLAGTGVLDLGQDASGTLFAWMRAGGLFASRDGAATWSRVDSAEALQRSGVEAGRGTLVVDPQRVGRIYLGNAGVIRVDE